MKVALPDLPYAKDALEPAIDRKTMEIHHGRHHAGYANNFQSALDRLPGATSVEEVLADIPSLPEDLQTTVRNNGGGHWNHDLFWKIMAPPGQGGGGTPAGNLAARINADFGSFAAFSEAFSEAGATRFGSGWAWLVARPDGSLVVGSTPNQDNPLMKGLVPDDLIGTPILGLDVWEHAYYLHYQNRRGDYISNWWKLVNWPEVSRRYGVI
ncbi:MAG: superoxide dismutase [Verrucomicrobia bacterium]|nr:superoxide dismutase [Verrucomicrobiota bacterium]MCH8510520.1 superoxide dismutase [Kiritimatiellia bacterium]